MAEELARRGHGVLEPFQRGASVDAQVDELRIAVENRCRKPVAVIGWSWGAWLGCLFAARHPSHVARLVLVGSGPFEAKDAQDIKRTRLSRLTEAERREYHSLSARLGDPECWDRISRLFEKMDTYCPDNSTEPHVTVDPAIHRAVWAEAAELRRSGDLLDIASTIRCPVTALHGDYDPHPYDGVRVPLARRLDEFAFILLRRCGHKPWREIHARDIFFRELEKAIR